ncbi:MAG: GIDE domain-containing protein [Elusimicrobiota bacterium]
MNITFHRGMFGSKWGWLRIIPIAAFLVVGVCVLIGLGEHETNRVFGYFHEIAGISAGFGLFLFGFMVLKKKWLIDNTPTSKIRSVAMGFSEVKGKAREKYGLKSRITLCECVFFKFMIEKRVKDSKGRTHWEILEQGSSTNYFYIEDDTGKLLVDPLDAEIVMPPDYAYTEGDKRYTEWCLQSGDQAYVLGTVKKFRDYITDRKEKLTAKLRGLKADKKKMMEFDANKDGQICGEEWDKAVKAVEEELLREELQNPQPEGDDIVIAKGDAEKTFILSDRSENEVSRKMFISCVTFVIIGIVLVTGLSVSLTARIGLLPDYMVIPWETFYSDD